MLLGCLVKNSLMSETVFYRDATASSPVAKVWGEVLAHFHKTSQQYAELTVWPARMNSL
jgi:hypothetical protein